MKERRRKTTKRIYDKRSKVKNCRTIQVQIHWSVQTINDADKKSWDAPQKGASHDFVVI
jgi:hypothetical protein